MFSDREKITTLREAFENKIGKENVIYTKKITKRTFKAR